MGIKGGCVKKIRYKKVSTKIVLVLTLLSVAFIGGILSYFGNNDVVMIVNGIPVHKQELTWSMEEEAYKVKDQLAKGYKISKGDFSWSQQYGEKTAYEHLIEASMQHIIPIKIQQQEAKKRGLIDQISYKYFRDSWEKENKLREEKIMNDQVIYGPSQYEEKQYYDYVMNNLVIQLKKNVKEQELEISEGQVNQVYNLNREYFLNEPLDKVKNNVELLIVNQYYEEQIDRLIKDTKTNYINKKSIKEMRKEWGK